MSEKPTTFMGMPVTAIKRRNPKGKSKAPRAPSKAKQLRFFDAKQHVTDTSDNQIDIWVKDARLYVRLTPLWRGLVNQAANRFRTFRGPARDETTVLHYTDRKKYDGIIVVVSRKKLVELKGTCIAVHDEKRDIFVLLPVHVSEQIVAGAMQERARRDAGNAGAIDPVSITDVVLGYDAEKDERPRWSPPSPAASSLETTRAVSPHAPVLADIEFQLFEKDEERDSLNPENRHIDIWNPEHDIYVRLPDAWSKQIKNAVDEFFTNPGHHPLHRTEDGFDVMKSEALGRRPNPDNAVVHSRSQDVFVSVRTDWSQQIQAAAKRGRDQKDDELLAAIRRKNQTKNATKS